MLTYLKNSQPHLVAKYVIDYYYYYYTNLTASSRTTWVCQYQIDKTSLDLNEARDDRVLRWQWHQLDHMQTVCTLLQTDYHTNTSSLNFYRPGALPDVQPPTMSKHTHTRLTALCPGLPG